MNRTFIHLILIFLIISWSNVFSQEILSGLEMLPTKNSNTRLLLGKPSAVNLTVNLPFLDDFSSKSNLPSTSWWIDQDVFINNQFGIFPPSYGVATFDAVDDSGNFYTNAGPFQYQADKLTSAFINLASLAPSDSVYLSFFYQPQGGANDPETDDSLVLQFLEVYRADTIINTTVNPPDTTFIDKWMNMWSSKGMPLDSFRVRNHDKWFGLVLVPVKNPVFFKNTFRFRFYNYASLASNNIPSWQGNCDHWNLDYVYMNSGRSAVDTSFNDITLVNEASSFLKTYQSMPFRQFAANPAGEMRDSTDMLISNLSLAQVPSSYQFNVKDLSNSTIFNYSGGSWNLAPFATSGYQNYLPHAHPQFPGFAFPVSASDSSSYLITHYISPTGTTQQLLKSNDTTRFLQRFLNYYAYDDGSPELGYGLSPAGSQLAYRFSINVQDTLKGLLIAFNKTYTEANIKNFYLAVWNDQGGKPGDLIWRNKNTKRPVFNDTSFYSYYAFDSENPIVLADGSSFYVGMIQTTDDNLNIGFDVNNDASAGLYYNVAGSWEHTAYSGALMIRPVIGPNFWFSNKSTEIPQNNLVVYPNPNQGSFSLVLNPEVNDFSSFRLKVYSVSGQLIADLPFQTTYTLEGLTRGLYFIEFGNPSTNTIYRGKMLYLN